MTQQPSEVQVTNSSQNLPQTELVKMQQAREGALQFQGYLHRADPEMFAITELIEAKEKQRKAVRDQIIVLSKEADALRKKRTNYLDKFLPPELQIDELVKAGCRTCGR